jgi:hypothetical protein
MASTTTGPLSGLPPVCHHLLEAKAKKGKTYDNSSS